MRKLVTGRRMKEIDAYTIKDIGIPSMVLMERAALAAALEAEKEAEEGSVIWAVCGIGNNGADGVAAARMLHLKGYDARVVLAGDRTRGTEEFKSQLAIAERLGVAVSVWQEMEGRSCDILVDALFGVGLSRMIEGEYRLCMEMLERLPKRPYTVAVDVPSGIHSDTGAVMGIALRADVTVTFGWEKLGTALYPGREYAGRVIIDPVGFPPAALEDAPGQGKPSEGGEPLRAFSEDLSGGRPGNLPLGWAAAYEKKDLERIPGRRAYSNKGTFGRVLIAAGSKDMCGAAYLSALAAYRTGAGLVKILTVEENRQALKTLLPEAILAVYRPEQILEGREAFRKMIEEQMNWADVVVLGPGLGTEDYAEYLVEDILTSAFVPVILDADGLNLVAAHPYLTAYYTENIVITPHLGEMARLTGQSVKEIQADLPGAALSYASRYGITCVLKDAASVVAGKDGELYINTSGCSAMAKAGSGDVLTGIIAGLMAMGLEVEDAACLGVYVHGLAGEAASVSGGHSLLATELANAVEQVL